MSTGKYANVEIYLGGAKMAEAQSVKVSRTSKAQVIETMARGFAGMSPGAKSMTISIENAVPSADFEVNPGPFMALLTVVEITLFAAGRTLTSKMFVTDDNFSGSVNSPSQLSMDLVGEWADWV